MPSRAHERTAMNLFIDALREARSARFVVAQEGENFPDFVLVEETTGEQLWLEVVEAVESGTLRAAERRALRLYKTAAEEYRARGEEVVLEVSPSGVERVTPSPGFGVTGVVVPGGARVISPEEWIARALERKGRVNRYGRRERAKTTLLIDCSMEVLLSLEESAAVRDELRGNTMGFKEVWAVSANWSGPKGLLLAP